MPESEVQSQSILQVSSFPVLVNPWFMIMLMDFTSANYILEHVARLDSFIVGLNGGKYVAVSFSLRENFCGRLQLKCDGTR